VELSTAADWSEQAGAVRDALIALVPDVVGIYLHGSVALGGFGPTSDLDILVVAERGQGMDWAVAGQQLLVAAAGARPVELSIVDLEAAADPRPPWPFLVHVNSGQQRVVVGDEGGDPDLIAHYAVVRSAGRVLHGGDPTDVVGPIDRAVLVECLAGELAWGCAEADQRYAILNACRAVAYADDDALLSKVAGGEWWLQRSGPDRLVAAALHAQLTGVDLGPCDLEARAFVAAAITRLQHAAARVDAQRLGRSQDSADRPC
jgi:predicted nucleotidyltransferase